MYKWTKSINGGTNNLYVVSFNGVIATSKKSFEQAEKNLKRKLKK